MKSKKIIILFMCFMLFMFDIGSVVLFFKRDYLPFVVMLCGVISMILGIIGLYGNQEE